MKKKPVYQLKKGDIFMEAGYRWEVDEIIIPPAMNQEANTPAPKCQVLVHCGMTNKRFYFNSCKLVDIIK